MEYDKYALYQMLEVVDFKPVILGISSWIEHTPFAYWFTKLIEPKVFVELGTHYGVSYFSFCQAVKDNMLSTECYAVDSWRGDPHAGFYDEQVYEIVKRYNDENFSLFSTLLRMNFDEAVNYFKDGYIDLLHIDGYHTYESVKHDFETWLPKLSDGAFVLFHDTNVRERDFGVWKLWEELKESYPLHFEFYHGYGLGILQTSKNEKSWIINFLNNNASLLRGYFASLGKYIKERNEFNQMVARLQQVERQNQELQVKLREIEDKLVRIIRKRDKVGE